MQLAKRKIFHRRNYDVENKNQCKLYIDISFTMSEVAYNIVSCMFEFLNF